MSNRGAPITKTSRHMIIATVSTQRSGTKLLGACLASGTQVKTLGEIFNPDATILGCFTQFVRAEGLHNLMKLPADVVLDRYFAHIFLSWRPIHFDLMFNQLEIPCLNWNPFPGFFMYGYLRSRGALVIALERDMVDAYVSGKLLEKTGVAHGYVADQNSAPEPAPLNVAAYQQYAASQQWHREQLHLAMAGYTNFHVLKYSDVAASAELPKPVHEIIGRWAKQHKLNVNPEYVQMHPAPTLKTEVNYEEVFSNIEELRSLAIRPPSP